jgi:uncharacterized protein
MAGEWTIDPAKLSSKPRVIAGTVAPGKFPRLRDLLATADGELHYEVSAVLDGKRRKVVSCIIEGSVFLTCQSTLEVFRHPVKVKERLVLVEDESRLPPIQEEPDAEDHVVVEGVLDARNLIEDAVILALPMVPRKPGAGPAVRREAAPEKESPFAALKNLKRPRKN